MYHGKKWGRKIIRGPLVQTQENPDHSSKFVLHFTSNVDDQTRSMKAASHAVVILMQLVSLLAMP